MLRENLRNRKNVNINKYLLTSDWPLSWTLLFAIISIIFFYPAQKLSSAINQKQKRNKPYGNDPNTPP